MIFNYICPNCNKEVELEVSIDSPSDYYLLEDICSECSVAFPDSVNDLVYDKVIDYYSGKADLLYDKRSEK